MSPLRVGNVGRAAEMLGVASLFVTGVLLAAPLGAAQSIRVNGPLPAGVAGDVTAFQISPDSRRVVYSADQEEDGIFGLYSVPIGGGPVVRLAARIAREGYVGDFRITPDSRTVVYRGDPFDGGSPSGLFSVSIFGRQPATRLDEPFPRGDILRFELSPDSRRVVYLASQDWTTSRYELLSVPVNGGSRVRLNGPLVDGGSVLSYRLSPDGKRVVYLADQETDQVRGIYSVAIEGGAPVTLSVPLGAFADDFEIAPDSKSVVYRDADYEARLFSVSILGGATTQLAGASVELFRITPEARRVVYVRDGGLQVVRLTGSIDSAQRSAGRARAHRRVRDRSELEARRLPRRARPRAGGRRGGRTVHGSDRRWNRHGAGPIPRPLREQPADQPRFQARALPRLQLLGNR